jgi:hypothetical protein
MAFLVLSETFVFKVIGIMNVTETKAKIVNVQRVPTCSQEIKSSLFECLVDDCNLGDSMQNNVSCSIVRGLDREASKT